MTDPRLNKISYPEIYYQVQERDQNTGYWKVDVQYTCKYTVELISHKFLWWSWVTKYIPKYSDLQERMDAISRAKQILLFDKNADVKVVKFVVRECMNKLVPFDYTIWKNGRFIES
jgi:hypothetical protein